MEQYIKKSALVAEIEKETNTLRQEIPSCENKEHNKGKLFGLQRALYLLDTLEVKEVDLELITGWFDHIAQIADDRMTLTNQRMTDAHALDEIKCLAKNSSEFITKHYKAQKGE